MNRRHGLQSRDVWVRTLMKLPAGALVGLCRTIGLAEHAASFRSRNKPRFLSYYQGYVKATGRADTPEHLLKDYYANKALLQSAAPLVGNGRMEMVNRLVRVTGQEYVEQAMSAGKGAVLASAHVGSGGIPAAWLARQGHKVVTVRPKRMAEYIGTIHGDHAFFATEPMFLDWEDAPAAVLKRGLQALRGQGIISYMADGQFGARAADASMFGKPVQIRTGFAEVARMAGAPVIPAFGLADRDGLKIEYHPPIAISSAEDIAAFAQQFAALHERVLLENPHCLSWMPFERILFFR